jgi:hypothetical protein
VYYRSGFRSWEGAFRGRLEKLDREPAEGGTGPDVIPHAV